MITYKFKIQNQINIDNYLNQYNNILRYSYNRFKDNTDITLSQVESSVKSTMNHIDLMDASLIKIAVNNAKSLKGKDYVIFGGKLNFFKRKYQKITKEEYKLYKNKPIQLRGSSSDNNGNRKAKLNIIEDNSIIIKFNKNEHIKIQLPKLYNHRKQDLQLLQTLCEQNKSFFTIELKNDLFG